MIRATSFMLLGLGLVLATACGPKKETGAIRTVKKQATGVMVDGQEVHRYTLTNKNGVEASILNYGGAVATLKVPDRNGNMGDVVLGFDNAGWVRQGPHLLWRHHRPLRQPHRARRGSA